MGEQLQLGLEGDDEYLGEAVGTETFQQMTIALLEQIVANQRSLPDRLWDIDNVRRYFNASMTTTRRILRHPNAPKAIRLPTYRGVNSTSHLPARYVANDIITYATSMAGRDEIQLVKSNDKT